MTTVTISSSVTTIESEAFSQGTSLTTIIFPTSVKVSATDIFTGIGGTSEI